MKTETMKIQKMIKTMKLAITMMKTINKMIYNYKMMEMKILNRMEKKMIKMMLETTMKMTMMNMMKMMKMESKMMIMMNYISYYGW